MDPLDTYLTEHYEAIRGMAMTITRGREPDASELAHEVILSLYEGDRDRIHGLIDRKQMRYWIARIMMNQYNSSTSPFHYKFRKPAERHRNAAHEIREWHEPDDGDKELLEELHTFIEDTLEHVPYFERTVTEVYYNHNHSLNTLAAATGISRTTLYKAIKKTRDVIQQTYQETGPAQGKGAGRHD